MEGRRHGWKYQSCYCEENVYLMGEEMSKQQPLNQLYVVFISNASRSVLLTNQRAKEDGIVCWDYHVVLLSSTAHDSSIFDLDTRLSCPVSASEYLTQSFPQGVKSEYAPLFRLIPLQSYLDYFSSDRSHMLSESGVYNSPPPPWPVIRSPLAVSSNEIHHFISMQYNNLSHISQVLTLPQMISFIQSL